MNHRLVLTSAAAVAAALGLVSTLNGRPGESDDRPLAETRTAATSTVLVSAVVDGDTLRVESRRGHDLGRVRLLGIDAPEVAHGAEPAECYGDAATDLIAQLVPAGTVLTLTTDPGQGDRDIYGRLLRYVNHDGLDVAQRLLEQGAARLYDSEPELDRTHDYRAATEHAREHGLGLWHNC